MTVAGNSCDIILLRHGDSRKDGVRRYIGQLDDSLNEEGRQQAEYWHRNLADVPFRRFFCSDLKRCRETAEIIAAGRGVPVIPLVWLREISMGSWEGLPMAEIKRVSPEEYEKRGRDPAGYCPPGGESFIDLHNRVVPRLEELVQREAGPMLVVGHAGVNRVLLCHFLGMPLENIFRLGQDYCCCNLIQRREDYWMVRSMNIRSWTP